MPPVGFEPTISAVERPQTYTLDRAATGPTIHPIKMKLILKNFRITDTNQLESKQGYIR